MSSKSPVLRTLSAVIFLFILSSLLIPQVAEAAADKTFTLSDDKSILYWPFEDSSVKVPGSWVGSPEDDSPKHTNSDKKAQDWNLPGSDDCGEIVKSPISGTVLYAGRIENDSYGNQVVVQSDTDSTFAFRVAHLEDNSIEVSSGQKIKIDDKLGKVGNTTSPGQVFSCHAHFALYKDLDQDDIDDLGGGGFLTDRKNAAKFNFNANNINNCKAGQYKAEFFPNKTLEGDPNFVGCVNEIDYDYWGEGSIIPLKRENRTSAKFVGDFEFQAGTYQFYSNSDAGVRVWLDNDLVIDNWTAHTEEENSTVMNVTNGTHQVKVEYFEDNGPALLQFHVNLIQLTCDIEVAAGDVGQFVLAMDTANSNPDHTTICLTAGTPYNFSTVHNQIYGQTGIGVVGSPVTIDGRGAVVQRDPVPNVGMRLFAIDTNGSLTLKNITLNDGADVTNSYGGGAILNDGGELIVDNATFTNNRAWSAGGGAIAIRNGATAEITNSIFTGNKAVVQGSGGALSVRGATSTLIVDNVRFSNNSANNIGGVLYNQGISSFTEVNFLNNSATNNAGVIFNTGTTNVHDSCITGNSDASVYNAATNTIDFTNNWWGDASGPDTTDNFTGLGDSIFGPVTYEPFLDTAPIWCD